MKVKSNTTFSHLELLDLHGSFPKGGLRTSCIHKVVKYNLNVYFKEFYADEITENVLDNVQEDQRLQ